MSPYKLVLEKAYHLPMEPKHRAYWDIKKYNFDSLAARDKRLLQLNELDKFKNKAYEIAKLYNEKTKQWHDKRIALKTFEVEQKVILFNSRLKLFIIKLKSH